MPQAAIDPTGTESCAPTARRSTTSSAVLEQVARVIELRGARAESHRDEAAEVHRCRGLAGRVEQELVAQPVNGALRGELGEACEGGVTRA